MNNEEYTFYTPSPNTPLYEAVEINITGFGPFMSIKENPSWVLGKNIKDNFDKFFDKSILLGDAREVLVTVKDAISNVEQMYQIMEEKRKKNPKIAQILIHMGVFAGSGKFTIEKFARNIASFDSDEGGYNAPSIKLLNKYPLYHQLETLVPVEFIHKYMTVNFAKKKKNLNIKLGNNP